MNLHDLKTALAEDADLAKLVSVPRGKIPRFEIKLALMQMGKLEAVTTAIPQFATDADFAEIDVLSPLTLAVFAQLKSAAILTDEQVETLTDLGSKQVPRWAALGFPEMPHAGDIEAAINL